MIAFAKPPDPCPECPCDCCSSCEPDSITITEITDEPCPMCEEADILQRILEAIREWWDGKTPAQL